MDRAIRVQVRARERLKLLVPIVLFIIFMLLYMTFHSASEATIVMLSVAYAMTGGVILQWLLGYNFSVAVWVGYIALYGVAVQTGVGWWCTSTKPSTRGFEKEARSRVKMSCKPPSTALYYVSDRSS
jgi:Cu/Ag efflux pump CusA